MNDAVRRSIRGFLQVSIVQAAIQFAQAFGANFSGEQVAAITTVATPILILIQNLLEDNTSFPAILKAPASEGVNPQPDGVGDTA